MPGKNIWSCSKCSFRHEFDGTRCAMCNSLRVTTAQMRNFIAGRPINENERDDGYSSSNATNSFNNRQLGPMHNNNSNNFIILDDESPMNRGDNHNETSKRQNQLNKVLNPYAKKRNAENSISQNNNDIGAQQINQQTISKVYKINSRISPKQSVEMQQALQSNTVNNIADNVRVSTTYNQNENRVVEMSTNNDGNYNIPHQPTVSVAPKRMPVTIHNPYLKRQSHPQPQNHQINNNYNNQVMNQASAQIQISSLNNNHDNKVDNIMDMKRKLNQKEISKGKNKTPRSSKKSKKVPRPAQKQQRLSITVTSNNNNSNKCLFVEKNVPLQNYEPGPVPLIQGEEHKTWIYPRSDRYAEREYQLVITQSTILQNTLVSLPTGLGKTLIAAVAMYNFYRWFPTGKVVFLAPTRPLVTQQIEACYNIMGIPMADTAEISGRTKPSRRSDLWKTRRVFFCTPQSFQKDLEEDRCDPKQVVCLVLDEAHRASGKYAYVQAIDILEKAGAKFRVVGLSATPGKNMAAINDIVTALRISKIEARLDSDNEVKKYIHSREYEKILVDSSEDTDEVSLLFSKLLDPYLNDLRERGFLYRCNKPNFLISSIDLVNAMSDPNAVRDPSVFQKAKPIISLLQARAGLVKQGLNFVKARLITLKNNIGSKRGFALHLIESEAFVKLFNRVIGNNKLSAPSSEQLMRANPKLSKLKEILMEHFNRANAAQTSSRVIVFCLYRDSVLEILSVLESLRPIVMATKFIGQGSRGSTNVEDSANDKEGTVKNNGMNQKEQQKVIKDFRKGKHNVLVCTSIGEEGLDIGEVDLIVNFDCLRSATRMIQRMGRTGRARNGRVVYLISKGSEENTLNESESSIKFLGRALKNPDGFTFKKNIPLVPLHPILVRQDMNIASKYRLSQVGGHSHKKSSIRYNFIHKNYDEDFAWKLSIDADKRRKRLFGKFKDGYFNLKESVKYWQRGISSFEKIRHNSNRPSLSCGVGSSCEVIRMIEKSTLRHQDISSDDSYSMESLLSDQAHSDDETEVHFDTSMKNIQSSTIELLRSDTEDRGLLDGNIRCFDRVSNNEGDDVSHNENEFFISSQVPPHNDTMIALAEPSSPANPENKLMSRQEVSEISSQVPPNNDTTSIIALAEPSSPANPENKLMSHQEVSEISSQVPPNNDTTSIALAEPSSPANPENKLMSHQEVSEISSQVPPNNDTMIALAETLPLSNNMSLQGNNNVINEKLTPLHRENDDNFRNNVNNAETTNIEQKIPSFCFDLPSQKSSSSSSDDSDTESRISFMIEINGGNNTPDNNDQNDHTDEIDLHARKLIEKPRDEDLGENQIELCKHSASQGQIYSSLTGTPSPLMQKKRYFGRAKDSSILFDTPSPSTCDGDTTKKKKTNALLLHGKEPAYDLVSSQELTDTPDQGLKPAYNEVLSYNNKMNGLTDTPEQKEIENISTKQNDDISHYLTDTPSTLDKNAKKEKINNLAKLRKQKANPSKCQFLDIEADCSSDCGESNSESNSDGIGQSQDSFINDSSQLGCTQDPSMTQTYYNVNTYRQVDGWNEEELYSTPLLRRNNNLTQRSIPSSDKALGKMHFIKSILDHHRKGGDSNDIEREYNALIKESMQSQASDNTSISIEHSSQTDNRLTAEQRERIAKNKEKALLIRQARLNDQETRKNDV